MTTINIKSNYLQFLNSGTNYGRITGTSDGLLTLSSNAGDVRIAGAADPSGSQDVATKNYADIIFVPGGLTTQLQYNNAGAFGGTLGFTFDGTDLTVATGSMITIVDPPVSGTDVVNKTYADSLTVSPAGSTTQVQYNNAGSFAGSTALTIQDATTIVLNDTLTSPDGSSSAGTNLNIIAGSGNGTNQNGGSVIITGGSATGTGTNGVIQLGSILENNVQYGFCAVKSGTQVCSDANTIASFTVAGTFKFDRNSGFDATTGIFTTPVTGIYEFSATIHMQKDATSTLAGFYFSYNGGSDLTAPYIHYRTFAANEVVIASGAAIMGLAAGTTIRIRCRSLGGTLTVESGYTFITGFLLG